MLIGCALGVFWVRTVRVLGLYSVIVGVYWVCIGFVLGAVWVCIVCVLCVCWVCIGHVYNVP